LRTAAIAREGCRIDTHAFVRRGPQGIGAFLIYALRDPTQQGL